MKFLLATAFGRSITVDIAAMLFEPSAPTPPKPFMRFARDWVTLETVGVLSRVETEADEKWKLPPPFDDRYSRTTPARESILARLSFLAHNRLDKGHHASALDYAVEAQNWTLAVDIVETTLGDDDRA